MYQNEIYIFVFILYNMAGKVFTAMKCVILNPLSANLTKWSNTLKQFVDKLPANCFSVFDHFVGLALKGLKVYSEFDKIFLEFSGERLYILI